MGYFIMAVKLKLRLCADEIDYLLAKTSTPYNFTKMALNYINKGLFCSPKIGL